MRNAIFFDFQACSDLASFPGAGGVAIPPQSLGTRLALTGKKQRGLESWKPPHHCCYYPLSIPILHIMPMLVHYCIKILHARSFEKIPNFFCKVTIHITPIIITTCKAIRNSKKLVPYLLNNCPRINAPPPLGG